VTDHDVLLALPAGIPWVLAAALALMDGRKRWVGILAVAGLGAGILSLVWLTSVVLREGTVETTAGGWPENIGITLRADALGVTFALVSVGVILASMIYEISLERVMNLDENGIGMRITRSAWFLRDLRFPHS
jgi:multicomponent Na+:H+ antiporter subunit D